MTPSAQLELARTHLARAADECETACLILDSTVRLTGIFPKPPELLDKLKLLLRATAKVKSELTEVRS